MVYFPNELEKINYFQTIRFEYIIFKVKVRQYRNSCQLNHCASAGKRNVILHCCMLA